MLIHAGTTVVTMTRIAVSETTKVTAAAVVGSLAFQSWMRRPEKKSISATSRTTGRPAMICGTFHLSKESKRA